VHFGILNWENQIRALDLMLSDRGNAPVAEELVPNVFSPGSPLGADVFGKVKLRNLS
jgi:hypothetical protein